MSGKINPNSPHPGISKRTGVYGIFNTVYRKWYVGSAARAFSYRWGRHRSDLRLNRHYNAHLQSAWNKYGEEAFKFRILEDCPPDACVEREQFWMDFIKPEYNLLPNAGSCLGAEHTPEHNERIRESCKGAVFSEEHRAKLKEAWKHRVLTDQEIERVRNLGFSNRGRKHSAESSKKKSLALMGNKNSLGCHPSEETRQKLAAVWRGKKHSVGTRILMSIARKMYWARVKGLDKFETSDTLSES